MSTTYAQTQTTAQKKDASSASSVFDASSQSESLQRKADMANNAAQRAEAPRPNNTGMPDNLKAGIESLSGFSMDDVRVHYNSSKPATVQALAYTQGTDIHVAPGQEKHLPHEAWHVAQQMAGRVSPTTNINGMPVNDNAGLEHEADVMGEKAVQCKGTRLKIFGPRTIPLSTESVQRITISREGEEPVVLNTLGDFKRWIRGEGVLTTFSVDELEIIKKIGEPKQEYDEVCLENCTCVLDVYNAYQQALNQQIKIGRFFYNCDTIGDLKRRIGDLKRRLDVKCFFWGGNKLEPSSKKASLLLQSIWSNTFFDGINIKDFKSFNDIETLVRYDNPIVLVKKYESNRVTNKSKERMRILESDSIYCYTHLTCDYNKDVVGATNEFVRGLKKRRDEAARKDFFPSDAAAERWVLFEKELMTPENRNTILDSFIDNVHITLEKNRYEEVMDLISTSVCGNINEMVYNSLHFESARENTNNEKMEEIIRNVKRNSHEFSSDVNCKIDGGGTSLKTYIDEKANSVKEQNENTLLKAVLSIKEQLGELSKDKKRFHEDLNKFREDLNKFREDSDKFREKVAKLSEDEKKSQERQMNAIEEKRKEKKEELRRKEEELRRKKEELRRKKEELREIDSTSELIRQTGDNYIEKIRFDTTVFAAYLTSKKMDFSKIDELKEI